MRLSVLLFLTVNSLAHAGPIAFSQVGGFFHGNGGLISQFDETSSSYFSTLDTNNLGSFGWSLTNTSGLPITNALFLVFLDADIDATVNTYFNEFGAFVALSLPPASPPGAIGTTSWEIDEPGFVFGNIYNNLLAGTLDNTNGVPSGSPDDVSFALGFALGTLNPGQTLTVTARTSLANIGGLSQTDPASPYQFYFNGYATTDSPVSGVPEPATFWPLTALCLAALTYQTRNRRESR